jgi:hypothetical protein
MQVVSKQQRQMGSKMTKIIMRRTGTPTKYRIEVLNPDGEWVPVSSPKPFLNMASAFSWYFSTLYDVLEPMKVPYSGVEYV